MDKVINKLSKKLMDLRYKEKRVKASWLKLNAEIQELDNHVEDLILAEAKKRAKKSK